LAATALALANAYRERGLPFQILVTAKTRIYEEKKKENQSRSLIMPMVSRLA
jgi:hypothetical protein